MVINFKIIAALMILLLQLSCGSEDSPPPDSGYIQPDPPPDTTCNGNEVNENTNTFTLFKQNPTTKCLTIVESGKANSLNEAKNCVRTDLDNNGQEAWKIYADTDSEVCKYWYEITSAGVTSCNSALAPVSSTSDAETCIIEKSACEGCALTDITDLVRPSGCRVITDQVAYDQQCPSTE